MWRPPAQLIIMPHPLKGGALSGPMYICLSDVCLSVCHFQGQKVKGHQAALPIAALERQAAAAVGVRTCWPWETAATLPSARRRRAHRRPRGGEGWGHTVAADRLQLIIIIITHRNYYKTCE